MTGCGHSDRRDKQQVGPRFDRTYSTSHGQFTRRSSQPLDSRSNRGLFDIWHFQIILGEELDETGGDGGGIPARQVVARTRYRHGVDFWNPLLQ